MDTPIGKWVGLSAKKLGAAKFIQRDALARLVAQRHPSLTIVLQDTLTGCLGGALARRLGVARMRARVAHLQLEGVPDQIFEQCSHVAI